MKYLVFVIVILLSTAGLYSQEDTVSKDIKITPLVYGTLLTPKTESNTLVIIVGGSGPIDRDGNQQMMRNNSLKMVAQGLAEEGIASFRYDKRIITLLRQGGLQEKKLSFDYFIEDAVAVVRHFKRKRTYDKIYVLGHSQGSLVGMKAASKVKADGFISLAGVGQSIDKVIVNQVGLQMPQLKDDTLEAFSTLKEKGRVKDFNPVLNSILRNDTQPFMLSWMKYNPAKEIARMKMPTLIINGTNDIQVDTQEAQILKDALPSARLEIIKSMNHVLKTVSDDDLENAKTYNDTTLPLATELIPIIKDFIQNQ